MTIKYYSLLKVKEVERGFGYSKGLETDEKVIKKSVNLEDLVEELELRYTGDKKEWILIPKYLLIDKDVLRYEKDDYVIVKSELKEDEMIEGIDYIEGAPK